MKKNYFFNLFIFVLIFILILSLIYHIKQIIYNNTIMNNTENFEKNNLSILHLVLYSNSELYDNMYNLTRKFYKKNKNVKTIYYKFCEDIVDDYVLIDDILYIKGTESFRPGILEKTLKTFKFFENEATKYDYIIRSNISTIINFNLLIPELIRKPINYSGGLMMTLYWTDVAGGLPDDTWRGTKFASGTAIMFSKEAFMYLIQNLDLLHKDIIDDVSIAIFFNKYFPSFINDFSDDSQFLFVEDLHGNYDNIKIDKVIFYRNRNDNDRNLDYIQMENIIKCIELQNYLENFTTKKREPTVRSDSIRP